MTTTNKAIVINGSPYRDGLTAEKCNVLDIPVIHLVDGIVKAIETILITEVIVFATPVHWFNVSSHMKQLIDALPEAPSFPCFGKTAYFIAVCEEDGGQQAINQMFGPLNHMGFQIPPWASYFYNKNIASKSENCWMINDLIRLRELLKAKNA